jgi:RNA polymerase sigma factor (TIGR02999 family)
MMTPSTDITTLLKAWGQGDPSAFDRLTPLVYDQLRRMASGYMRNERGGHELQTTALVHEAYLRLASADALNLESRTHFYALAARVMRRILVDAARKRASAKRGGREVRVEHAEDVDFDAFSAPETERASELCALDDALTSLASIDARRAQVVELRFFGGFSVEETASVLNVSPQTVMRDWRLARAWLTRTLRRDEENQR